MSTFALKAGMEGIDKEKIERTIDECSGETFRAHARKKNDRLQAECARISKAIASLSEVTLSKTLNEVNAFVTELEDSRDLSCTRVLLDMDAFFAAVEMRDDPRLRDVPMAVGGTDMLSTSNYVARRFGVRAAMPGFIAKKLCPELIIVPHSGRKYCAASKVFASVLEEYDPEYSMRSLDEAAIDLTDFLKQRTAERSLSRIRYTGDCNCRLPYAADLSHDNCEVIEEACSKCLKTRLKIVDTISFGTTRADVVNEIRFRVEQATGLTCSAGIAANYRLAKICADVNKPNGQFELPNDRHKILNYIRYLPVRKVGGIGPVTEAHLKAAGVLTLDDMWNRRAHLYAVFTALEAEFFLRVCLGLDCPPSENASSNRKSISVETTFRPSSEYAFFKEKLSELCEDLARQLVKCGIRGGHNVGIKVKLSTFDVHTRVMTVKELVHTAEQLCLYCEQLYIKEHKNAEIRLLGVRLSKLEFVGEEQLPDAPQQPSIKQFLQEKSPSEQGPSSSLVQCPICYSHISSEDATLNAHIDECLNKPLLKDCEPKMAMPKNKKRKIAGALDAFLAPKKPA